jgi:hypothetical protein
VSQAGTTLLSRVADKVGLTTGLSLRLAEIKQQRRGHDPGRVIRDLAVILADGGECVSDLGGVREQDARFGPVASDSTASRMIDRVAPSARRSRSRRREGAHATAQIRCTTSRSPSAQPMRSARGVEADVLCQTRAGFCVSMRLSPAMRWVAARSGRGPDWLGMVTVMRC